MVVHTSCDNICDLYKFRGSKFVQSDLRGIYNDIRNKLKSDKTVLFSGTPCQVAGLKNFLKGKYTENLYCIDIVCRGVPSPKVWHEYLSYIRKKYSSRIKKVKFRNKTYGYHSSTMLIEFDNGKVYKKSGRVDPMMKLFTREMCSRPSCAECVFKTKERISDLTLFDCKRYAELTGANDDDMGYTAVLVQSDKGSTMMRLADENIFSLSIDAEELISKCGIMVCGKAQPNQKRNEFFEKLGNDSIDKVLQSICPVTIKDRGIELSKNMLYSTGLIKIARKIKKHEKIEIK